MNGISLSPLTFMDILCRIGIGINESVKYYYTRTFIVQGCVHDMGILNLGL